MEPEQQCDVHDDQQADEVVHQTMQHHALGSIPQTTALAVPRGVPSERLRESSQSVPSNSIKHQLAQAGIPVTSPLFWSSAGGPLAGSTASGACTSRTSAMTDQFAAP